MVPFEERDSTKLLWHASFVPQPIWVQHSFKIIRCEKTMTHRLQRLRDGRQSLRT